MEKMWKQDVNTFYVIVVIVVTYPLPPLTFEEFISKKNKKKKTEGENKEKINFCI
jgi:hypothetical protein